MPKASVRVLIATLCTGLLASVAPARAQSDEALGFETTPPRLSFTDGAVSFLRLGADDWTPALVNTALAPGDELYADESANLELQVGPRAFVRAGENTQLGLTSLEPDYLQLRVTAGHVSLDLRSLKAGQTYEIDTPNAAFTVERTGYYRVEVDGDVTTFTSRRGGRATVTPASGDSAVISASEQVVVSGADAALLESYAAPELDAWDRWNYARTDDQIDAVSARYVPSTVYGVNDLDQYGDWRVVPSYGAVWVPRGVAPGWAPYSTGRWIYDPYYSWTWVDDAAWGWAPYHYGRWVRVSGYWGWSPGPIVARPYYAPALVAFYGGGFSIGLSIGTPRVGWVALGWGEPIVPWWGPTTYRRHAHWYGWGGPRVVNNVVVKNKTVIKGDQINIYQNAQVNGAIVGVDRDRFGRHSQREGGYTRMQGNRLRPLHGDLDVKPDRSSLVADARSAKRPPRDAWNRSVVATREPRRDAAPPLEARRTQGSKWQRNETAGAKAGEPFVAPAARVVEPPRAGKRIATDKRPPFGTHSDSLRRTPRPAPPFARSETAKQPPSEAKQAVAGRQKSSAESGAERQKQGATAGARPPAGGQPEAQQQTRSRGSAAPPAPAPATQGRRAAAPKPERGQKSTWVQPNRTQRAAPAPSDRARDSNARQQAPPASRELPGEPANRVYRPRKSQPASNGGGSPQTQRGQPRERSQQADPAQSGQRSPQADRSQPREKSQNTRSNPQAQAEAGRNGRGGR